MGKYKAPGLFGDFIDSYEFNLAALVQHSLARSIFASIAHNREAELTSYGPNHTMSIRAFPFDDRLTQEKQNKEQA